MKEKNKNKMKMLEAEVQWGKDWKVESLLNASNTVFVLFEVFLGCFGNSEVMQ